MMKAFLSNQQRGFSLLEVLIAVVVLSLGLLALASLQTSVIRAGSEAKSQTLALAVAKKKLDLLQSVESFGGSDGSCVSPSTWVTGQVSCYRAITSEAMPTATNVDGDPTLAGTQPLGGVEFRLGTTVTRFVYNKTTGLYDGTVANTAQSGSINSSTYLPGKEFKRIVVSVAWTEASGSTHTISVEDAIPGVVPRDSIALSLGKKGVLPRKAELIIVNPGAVAGVIPIAVGNGSNTAASNPTPELKGTNNVIETRFDVFTYIPLTATTALAQSRVETSMVGCRCDTAAASQTETALRPTYWDGLRYAVPTSANYTGLTSSATAKNYPLAGAKALAQGEEPQSVQCRACCRDHFDPSGNDPNGDPRSAIAKFSPRRSSHTHYLVNDQNGARALQSSGVYSEVCRMIRVDGLFRVAADLNNDYFAMLPARNTGVSAFVPSNDVVDGAGLITQYGVAGDYGDMVKRYLSARFSSNTNNATYNDPTSPNPYSTTYSQGIRTGGASSRSYDLNDPASYYLKLTNDARWLHARGLYIDYLEPEAIAKIDDAKSTCTAADPNECVLPYLPFTSINLSELAAWSDIAINPNGAASGTVLSVMNNGFQTATGDVTYPVQNSSGSAGSTTVSFAGTIDDKIVPGMALSGAGIANNARVVSIAGNMRSVVVDLPNLTGGVSGTITFQGAPVRGRATPGSSAANSYASNAHAAATYNNAVLALKFPMNDDEAAVTTVKDSQRFDLSAGGSPPDPTAGTFRITVGTGYSVNSTTPKMYWGTGGGSPSVANACTNAPVGVVPYSCDVTSGLGGPMSVLVGSYNVPAANQNVTFTDTGGVCTWRKGSAEVPCPGPRVSGPVSRPFCKNYKVSAASSSGITYPGPVVVGGGSASGSSPYIVGGASGKASETTELRFGPIYKDVLNSPAVLFDTVTVTLVQESAPDDLIPSELATGSCSNMPFVKIGGSGSDKNDAAYCTFDVNKIAFKSACQ